MTTSSSDTARDRYWELVTVADRELDARLAEIRRQQDLGQFGVLEAAQARVEALEGHLAQVRQLRCQQHQA